MKFDRQKKSMKKALKTQTTIGGEMMERKVIHGTRTVDYTMRAFDWSNNQNQFELDILEQLDASPIQCHSLTEFGVKKTHINKPLLLFFTVDEVMPPYSNFMIMPVAKYRKDYSDIAQLVFIDPGVHDLEKYGQYKKLDKLHELAKSVLPDNTFISIDYSTYFARDDNDKANFIKWTYENNLKYAKNMHYICALQNNGTFPDFLKVYNSLKDIFYDKHKIIAIGGGLISYDEPNALMNEVFAHLTKEAPHLYWIHFYGMNWTLCEYYLPKLIRAGVIVSVDHTKWRWIHDPILELKYKGRIFPPAGDGSLSSYLLFIQKMRSVFDVVH